MAVLLPATFALVRAGYLLMGVRFDASPLTYAWQFIDIDLMRHRLLESCFYLHGQPPGFNLFLGAVVNLFGTSVLAFHVLFAGFGLALYAGVYWLMRLMGTSRAVAYVLATVFMAGPAFVQYEHYLFYTMPVTGLVTLSAACFHQTLKRGRKGWTVCFFLSLFVLCVVRSLFHALYFVAVGILAAVLSPHRRQAVLAGLLFLGGVLALYAKNGALFGKFAASSWMGMNGWRLIGRQIPPEDCRRLVAQGDLSDVAEVRWFSPLDEYPERFRRAPVREDVPVLSAPLKSTGGVNYNHEAYIAISDEYLRNCLRAIRLRPGAFVAGLASSWFIYFTAASDYGLFVESNVEAVAPVKAVYDTAFCGRLPWDLSQVKGLPKSNTPRYVYLVLLAGLPLLLVYAAAGVARGRIGASALDRPRRASLAFMVLTVAYVAFFGNLFEAGENNRFRFMTDPMYLVFFGLFLEGTVFPWVRRKRRRASPWDGVIAAGRPGGRAV